MVLQSGSKICCFQLGIVTWRGTDCNHQFEAITVSFLEVWICAEVGDFIISPITYN